MYEQTQSDTGNHSFRGYFIHLSLLLAAMGLPFAVTDPVTASFGSAAIGVAYVLWLSVASMLRDRKTRLPGISVLFALMAYMSAIPMIAVGSMLVVLVGWISWAYGPHDLIPSASMLITTTIVVMIVIPILLVLLLPLLLKNGDGPAARLVQGIRKKGVAAFHLSWIGALAMFLGLSCILVFTGFVSGSHELEKTRQNVDTLSFWELSVAFPILILSLFTGAVMLAMTRYGTPGRGEINNIVRAYIEGSDLPTGMSRRSRTVLSGIVAGGWATTILVIAYPVHLGLVAALGPVAGLTSLTDSIEAVDFWIVEQRDAGRTTSEIAAELNTIGFWSPDQPNAGLATLVEDSESVFNAECSARATAAVTDPASHAASDWLPDEEMASDLKYCIVIACPSPVTWDAPPALLLGSSHESRATYWIGDLYIDLFAEGRARAAGGYCNADGTLADEFRG